MIVRALKSVMTLSEGLARTVIARRCHIIQRAAIMEMSTGTIAVALGKMYTTLAAAVRLALVAHVVATMLVVMMGRKVVMETVTKHAKLIQMDADIGLL